MKGEAGEYVEGFDSIPQKIYSFLESEGVARASSIGSTWKKRNNLFRVTTKKGEYVLKLINEGGGNEIERILLLRKTYGELFPSVFLHDQDAYLMEFVEGGNFFDLPENERAVRVADLGVRLRKEWARVDHNQKVDIRNQVKRLFYRYRESRAQFFEEDELREINFDYFTDVPNIPSHNDLNCANVIFNGNIKLIDPSDEGYNDIARDVGRFLASSFFNNYDRLGNNKMVSLEIAEAFVSGFDAELMGRAKFYAGESFMSFLKFQTISVEKGKLKELAVRTLTGKKPLLHCLEDSL